MTATARPVAALEAALRERGLLPDPGVSLPEPGPGRPWFVSALLGVSGWIAGLFALGFVVLVFRPDRAPGLATLGLAVLGLSLALFRLGEGAFVAQGALALSIAAHGLLGAAAFEATDSATTTAFLVAALQVAWIAVVPARLPRLLATLVSPASHPLGSLAFWESDATRTSWLALWPIFSVGAALWALWLAHRLRSAALAGTAIAGALLHVFHFYLLLGISLVAKSAVMVGLGLALVAGALVLRRGEAP